MSNRPIIPEGLALRWYDIRTDDFVFIHPDAGYYTIPDQRNIMRHDIVVQDDQHYVPISVLGGIGAVLVKPNHD